MADEKGTRYQMLESKSECSVVYQYSVRNIRPFADRDFVLSVVYQAMESGGDGVISATSTEHAAATSNDNFVRATVTRLFRFSRVTPTLTRFTVTTTFDLRGSVPRFVSDTLTTPTAARAPLVALDYFIKIKKTAGFDAAGQDARALGQLLVHNTEPVRTKKGGEQLESKLHTFFDRTTVLRELADVYPWFPTMLIEVLRNVQHRPRTTKAKLSDFTERDAQVTGRAMKMLMLSNATPDAAVDEWILTFPALRELETAHPFFRPFMNVIVQHILSIADFGLKMRLFSGAGLSVFDLVSDIYMITVFLGSDETRGAAYFNIACVAFSLFCQLYVTWLVNRKRPLRRIARELLYVVTAVKPGIDAARVAAGNENDDGLASVDPLQELTYSKMLEIVFESIPAAIIQTRAFLVNKEQSKLAFVSIVISCLATGFGSATIWYDFDTSPQKRRQKPRFAGATPDTSRGPFFFLLVVSGALQIAAKSFSSALLLIASPIIFLAYTVGDHALYQGYLVVRGDHRFYNYGVGVSVSVLFRVVEKVLADFTSCWRVSVPICMHNAYFLFNQLTTQASVFVSVHVYVSSGFAHLSARALWMSAGSLFAVWTLTYTALVCMVKPEYRVLFCSTETCVEYVRTLFEADDDGTKMRIFTYNEVKWAHYKDEVRDFTHANWARWKEEQPGWFTEEVIQSVPDEYIPVAALASLNAAAHGGKRRRSSLGLVESVRRGSISDE
ncbi:hypothetical protein TeGR_g7534 [Tetraparma gracilis]|uniref:Uncharacterized protein n=1 Tax=Tetraparma gracilis TaxID=2962635 RepID=A0ABQ6MN80_9STRA|nr:hypothetical protein TeGR_g7534 [Tetraparma gracilis]